MSERFQGTTTITFGNSRLPVICVVGTVPSYFGLDSTLAWHVNKRLELSIAGQNLLHEYHVEYGFPSPTREQIVRSVFARITWGY